MVHPQYLIGLILTRVSWTNWKTAFNERFGEFREDRMTEQVPNWCLLEELEEKAMATHSSILAWKIPWMEEPGRLQSMGSRRVGHDWGTSLLLFTFMHWRRKWQPTPVLLPGKSHGRRSLVGCSPWGRKELDMTEWLHFHFSLSCIGEGDGNPFQCSCLENPRDGGAWWAAIYGVAQGRTWLTWLSSSNSRRIGATELVKGKSKSHRTSSIYKVKMRSLTNC